MHALAPYSSRVSRIRAARRCAETASAGPPDAAGESGDKKMGRL